MSVRIIIDSASDILPQEARELGLVHLPMKVIFGDREFRDGVDLSHQAFYTMLVQGDHHPTTCQVSPAEFEAACRQVVEAGEEALVITVSAKLSGTYQSACIAAEEFPGQVWVVDSNNVCIGERILVLRGLELAREGLSAREIAARLDREKGDIRLLALLDTLEYLKRGGRISAATALAGNLLAIKPVVAVEDGQVVMVGKARGTKKGKGLLQELVDQGKGVDFTRPVTLAYSGLSDELLQSYIQENAPLWQGNTQDLPIATVGATIGTHAGPGAIAVAFFAQE